jgi:signal transduction histidine kinase/CheY-like chemotaxis protein
VTLAGLLRLAEPPMLVEQVRLTLSNTSTTVVLTFLLVGLLVLTLTNPANATALWMWAAIQMALKLFSAWDARRRLRAGIAQSKVQAVVLWLVALNLLDGLVWGSLAWITLDGTTLAGSVLVIAVLAGVAASALASLSAVPQVLLVFVGVMMLTVLPKVWLLNDPAFDALAGACFLYAALLMMQSRNSAAAIRAAITLRFRNLGLIDQLRVETERARAAHREADEANMAKSKFLAAASHDLRQPVHAQGLFLGVLGRSELTDVQRRVLDSATAASKASAEMLNTLLDFSRVEAGVVKPRLHPFALQELFNKVENDLAPEAEAKGLVYRTHETTLALHSDPALVELILRNLVSNAVRYTERGGVLVACRRRCGNAVVEVWDTGIGIEPGQQREVFREFHQLGNPERDRRKGLGLGLAIAQGMARALGQELHLQSQPGRGSVFRLALPQAQGHGVAHPMPDTALADMLLPGARVLLIEDDASVLEGMQALLHDWGCECDATQDIDEAIALARANLPDAIVSDYRLRGMRTGAEAIAALRAEFGQHLPALLITGDTAPERLREAAASGVPLLHKPVWPSDLQRGLAALLNG